jgi:hypothetical protein
MSLVTAAMLYSSRRARERASMRAVFPEPTGLFVLELRKHEIETARVPSDANGESAILPVTPLNQRHFAVDVRARAIEDLVRVAMVGNVVVGVRVRVRVSHYC